MRDQELHIEKFDFDQKTGYRILYSKKYLFLFLLLVLLVSFYLAKSPTPAFLILGVLVVSYVVSKFYQRPKLILDSLFIFSFFAIGLTRFLPLPLGLTIDFLIVVTWLVIFFKDFKSIDWRPARNILTLALGLWALYCILEVFNGEAKSVEAWFYAVRGLAMYGIMLVPLVFIFYRKPKHFLQIINIWFAISIVCGLYGAKQYWFGLFQFEQAWLDRGAHNTHVLWGVFCRMFSFASDANQFGCSQAQAGIVALIFSFVTKSFKRKLFYWITAVVCIYGMLISGTRGAIVIPIVGFAVYLFLSRNFKAIIIGGLLGGVAFYILAFTFMFHSVAPIRRMRTAFNATEDASFIVRMENRKMLANYLADKPFGGGIGTAGIWGQRFSPGTFLAEFETDGHYVRIYAETGIVGLFLYYSLFGLIIFKIMLICWRLKDPFLRNRMIALTASFLGIMVSNYSAPVIIILPTSIITLWILSFVIQSEKWDGDEKFLAELKRLEGENG